MKYRKLIPLFLSGLLFISCDLSETSQIDTPEFYEFTRNGESTVAFPGQTTRILMATELVAAMTDFDRATEDLLLQMYRNQTENGGDADPYTMQELNNASKSVKSKVAASTDYFSSNTTLSSELKNSFEDWINRQVNEVFPNRNTLAEPGVPGQIADGSSTRYINGKGFEYDQLVGKGLIGALMTDQILNNYLSRAVLDAGTNRKDNDEKVLVDGKNYTSMEHKWDEAFGYLYGNAADYTNPNATLGQDDAFLNKYLYRLNADDDFAGIAEEVFNAFALGRAAIVEGDYDLRDEQAQIIREKLSILIGVRAVYYLESGKRALQQPNPDYGAAFHDLSEGAGFIYSLQFTRVPNSDSPYFTTADVNSIMEQLNQGQGLWDISPQTLSELSEQIASGFDFTVEEAAN